MALAEPLTQSPNPGTRGKLTAELAVPPQPFSFGATKSCDFLGSCEDGDWSCEDLRSSSSSVDFSPAQDRTGPL